MTKKQLANMLHGRQYREEISRDEEQSAKENGLVVVFGASDDLMEFRGAIYDEVDCFEGGKAHVDESGLFESMCDSYDCPYLEKERAKCKSITAIWRNDNPNWMYKTDIPHETFCVYEDADPYCVGIVFEMRDLK